MGGWGCPHDGHTLIKIKSVPNYCGGKQQRCICCNKKTIWCCGGCTTGPMALVPLCPEITKWRESERGHNCLKRHRDNPALLPTRRGQKGGKRARGAGRAGSASSDEEEDD